MIGSASGSLCPASPRAAQNLREGWSRAAWYFRWGKIILVGMMVCLSLGVFSILAAHFNIVLPSFRKVFFLQSPFFQGQQSREG